MSQSLVAFDTDRIKDYIFATGRLKEIRGASALLDWLNRVRMVELAGVRPIFANGGAGLFTVETSQVQPLIQEVSRAYREHTYTASISSASVELPGDGEENIREQLKLLRYRLRAAKSRQHEPVLPLTHSLLRFCDSCGDEYSSVTVHEEPLCQSCHRKRLENDGITGMITDWTSGASSPEENRLWGRLIKELGETEGYAIAGYERPSEFETLGELSRPRNYMGLIYADGDNMGREIEKISGLKEMERFSSAVDESVYQAVREAIADHLQPEEKQYWPFDILMLGGDDLVMVARAQDAIRAALSIVKRFPELTAEKWGTPLHLSASVILTHVNYPIGSLLQLAESNLKFAKRESARRELNGEAASGGLLNFLVVSSSNHLDFDQYFRQTLKEEEGRTTFYRTRRPYTAADMEALLAQIEKLGRVPRTKLQQLRAAVFKSKRQGTVDAMMATLRLSDEDQRQALLGLVGTTEAEQLHLPWMRRDEDWVTPVLDIVELFDFC